MLHTNTKTSTCRAGLAGVGRVYELHPHAGRLRLVGNEGLQLSPGPAMQAGAHASPRLNACPDVRQVLHGDLAAVVSYRFLDNGLADFVVDVLHVAGFAARDFLQQLPCRLRAFALKPPSKGKESVAVVPEFATVKELSGADGGDGVLPKINPGDLAGGFHGDFGEVKYQVEVELPLAAGQLRFLGDARFEEALLILTQFHRDDDMPQSGKQGESIAPDAVGPLIEVDGAGVPERNHWPVCFSELRVVGQQGLVGLRHRSHSVAGHLGTEGGHQLPGGVVTKVMQFDPVGALVLYGEADKRVAGVGELPLQERQSAALFRRGLKFYADGTLHSTPALDVLGTFDVPLDRFDADVSGGADVVGRRPESIVPHGLLQSRERQKELSGGDPLEKFHGSGYGISGGDRQKQVDLIGLHLQGDHLPAMPGTNLAQHGLKGRWYFARQDRLTILWAPHHMVCCLVDTVSASDGFNHSHIVPYIRRHVNYKRFLPRLKSGVSVRERGL